MASFKLGLEDLKPYAINEYFTFDNFHWFRLD
jgi:hypothetical protein